MNLSKFAVYSILPLSLAMLVGCDSNDGYTSDFPAPNVPVGEVRYTPVVADAPRVRFAVDGNDRTWQSFGATSNLVTMYGGDITVTAESEAVDDGSVAVPGTIDITVTDNTRYDVFAIGSWGDGSWELYEMPEVPTGFAESDTSARVSVAHLAPEAPMVDVYLTAPDAVLAESAPLGAMEFEQNLGPIVRTAGEYRVRITQSGTTDVVYDSGTVEFAAGDDVVAVAIENTDDVAGAADKSPVSLLVLTDGGSSVMKSADDGAELRFVNASPNTGTVDTAGIGLVFSTEDADTTIATSVSFPEVVDYSEVAPGDYDVSAPFPTSGASWLEGASASLAAGETYTALLMNTVQDLDFLLVEDDPRPIFNMAKLRVIHASSVAGSVDIYVTEESDIEDADAETSGVAMGAATGYWTYDPGTYYVTVTPAGETTAAIGPLEVDLSAGGVYTIVARDNATLDGADVTLLGDFE